MGAPKGNRNGAHDKPWTLALQRHIAQNPERLRLLAIKTFDMALAGDMRATNEIGDRLDGKPKQTIDGDLTIYEPDDDAALVRHRIAARVAARLARIGDSADSESGTSAAEVRVGVLEPTGTKDS